MLLGPPPFYPQSLSARYPLSQSSRLCHSSFSTCSSGWNSEFTTKKVLSLVQANLSARESILLICVIRLYLAKHPQLPQCYPKRSGWLPLDCRLPMLTLQDFRQCYRFFFQEVFIELIQEELYALDPSLVFFPFVSRLAISCFQFLYWYLKGWNRVFHFHCMILNLGVHHLREQQLLLQTLLLSGILWGNWADWLDIVPHYGSQESYSAEIIFEFIIELWPSSFPTACWSAREKEMMGEGSNLLSER